MSKAEVVVMDGEPVAGLSSASGPITLARFEPQPRYVEFDGRRFFAGMLTAVGSANDDTLL